jgi:ribonucleoside-diphosphate reductase alpha chain
MARKKGIIPALTKASRPKILEGVTVRVATGCGNMYITLNHDKAGKLFEIFATLGKSGGCAKSECESLTKAMTSGLRYGIPVEEFIDKLEGVVCQLPSYDDGVLIKSCSDAIAKTIKQYYLGQKVEPERPNFLEVQEMSLKESIA